MNNSIKENLISFSQSWESYISQCKVEENGKEYFRNTKEQYENKFIHLAPNTRNEAMDLFDVSDRNFIRSELSQSP